MPTAARNGRDAPTLANRKTFDEHLVTGFLPLVSGLADRLREGGRACDVGCGTGRALVVLAREFPAVIT